jgi:hypothetical protein
MLEGGPPGPPILKKRGNVLVLRKVTVIGLGTLGGFLCKHISELENIKEMVIVDNDIVESKNVFSSIYKYSHIGEYKVDALKEIIEDDVAVTIRKQDYREGSTILPLSDLVIDCRDVVCDRKGEIDVRLFISERILIFDCRKFVRNTCSYDGSYSLKLNKSEINKAAFFAAQIINSEELPDMIKNNMVQRIDLNLLPSVMSRAIRRTLENKIDIIYDLTENARRLHCIDENIRPILTLNKQKDTKVFVGTRDDTRKFPEVITSKYQIIPQNSLKDSFDVIQKLTEVVQRQPGVRNFIVTVRSENGEDFVELLEETGAA